MSGFFNDGKCVERSRVAEQGCKLQASGNQHLFVVAHLEVAGSMRGHLSGGVALCGQIAEGNEFTFLKRQTGTHVVVAEAVGRKPAADGNGLFGAWKSPSCRGQRFLSERLRP